MKKKLHEAGEFLDFFLKKVTIQQIMLLEMSKSNLSFMHLLAEDTLLLKLRKLQPTICF